MKNADGRQDDKQVLLFSSQRISEHPGIRLTHGGFILIGLMSGGDYDTVGISFSIPTTLFEAEVLLLNRVDSSDAASRSLMG